ncbi:hypothetical protein N7510_005932 [Penicillium lagena]|uniref:uncharacterized protein n=1 Tax=Penicillium lagena TaxID=94218 RepID=UPI0025409A4B|nr:uncharacterized protein N7510_005932 [Penicillium lagena]KAJ5612738.1 hypothetical protein N7510_005932 [Penicillium lagena]
MPAGFENFDNNVHPGSDLANLIGIGDTSEYCDLLDSSESVDWANKIQAGIALSFEDYVGKANVSMADVFDNGAWLDERKIPIISSDVDVHISLSYVESQITQIWTSQ